MKPKRNAIRDPEGRKSWALEKLPHGCQVCGTRNPDFRGYSVHHLLPGRFGRSDEPCNYLLICGNCHDVLENRKVPTSDIDCRDAAGHYTGYLPTIPLGMAMTIKCLRDVSGWSLDRLIVLSGERLPLMLKPHDWINEAYRRNNGPSRHWTDETQVCLDELNEIIESYEILR